MNTVIVYHASLCNFDQFKMQKHGLHFGSLESAELAVLRKRRNEKTFYLYSVSLNTETFVESHDLGYNWYDSFKYESSVKGYKYSNRFEPSTRPSYVTWDINNVKILKKEVRKF